VEHQVLFVGRDAEFFVERLRPHLPKVGFRSAPDAQTAPKRCAPCDVLCIRTDEISAALVAAMPRLRLIQALTTGTDHIEALPNLPAGVTIAASRGFHGPQMSELAFIYMLHFMRDIRGLFATQAARHWNRVEQKLLAGRTAVLVGVGAIAEELAKRCKAFGMRVIGVSNGRAQVPEFDLILPRTRLKEAAAIADFLIVLLPHRRDTHHAIDASVLAAMRPEGVLINLARGGVVDEAALISALKAQRIAGAGLDVFAAEPLPKDSPLWNIPNVFVTSHVGGMSDTYGEQVLPLLIENLAAFASGHPERMRYIVRNGHNDRKG
jgi:D-2-hydroxyacid dehydrogenase (NADP+)